MHRKSSIFLYSSAFAVTCIGAAYSIVPLYKIICQKTGMTGLPQFSNRINDEKSNSIRFLRVKFVANKGKDSAWSFSPSQNSMTVKIGQSSLAFFRARNISSGPTIGFATYNIVPPRAALYFNKIQCFCFEEQRLDSNEEIEMPIFYYIDPDFSKDPLLKNTDELILSYTLFNSANE